MLADPQAALMATTGSLAEGAGVSQASVVRFCRALGYAGLPDLRLALAQELSRRDLEHERSGVAHGRIDASDSLADLAAKIAFHEARSIEQTARRLDLNVLEEGARAPASRAQARSSSAASGAVTGRSGRRKIPSISSGMKVSACASSTRMTTPRGRRCGPVVGEACGMALDVTADGVASHGCQAPGDEWCRHHSSVVFVTAGRWPSPPCKSGAGARDPAGAAAVTWRT